MNTRTRLLIRRLNRRKRTLKAVGFIQGVKSVLEKVMYKIPEDEYRTLVAEINDMRFPCGRVAFFYDWDKGVVSYDIEYDPEKSSPCNVIPK